MTATRTGGNAGFRCEPCTGRCHQLGLAPVGGDILFIEAIRTPGTGRLILTGLREVMRERPQAALSVVKNRAGDFGVGPLASTRVTFTCTSRRGPSPRMAECRCGHVRDQFARFGVTGWRDQGEGGSRFARRHPTCDVAGPQDFEDIPEEVHSGMSFVDTVDAAVAAALEPAAPASKTRATRV